MLHSREHGCNGPERIRAWFRSGRLPRLALGTPKRTARTRRKSGGLELGETDGRPQNEPLDPVRGPSGETDGPQGHNVRCGVASSVPSLSLKDSPMDEMIKGLIESRGQLYDEAKALSTRGNLSASERSRYEVLVADIEAMDARIDELHELNVRNKAADRQRLPYQDIVKGKGTTRYHNDSPEVEQVRTLLRGETAKLEWNLFDAFQERALALGATSTGGAAVPNRLLNRLIDTMVHREPLLDVLRQEPVDHYGDMTIPYVVSEGTASYTQEAGTISQNDPTFNTMAIPGAKAAVLLKASTELVDSDAVNIENFIVRDMGRALATRVGVWLASGTAEPLPEGIFWAAGTAVSGSVSDYAPSTDEVIDLYYSVSPEWRSDGVFIAADDSLHLLRKRKDGQNRYLLEFLNGLSGASPAAMMTRPVYTTTNATVGSAAASLVFMSPEATVFRNGPLRIEQSRDAFFSTDEVGFRAAWSVGHRIVQHDGVKAFAGTAG